VKFKAISQWALNYSVVDLCSALRVSTGGYYHWRCKPAKLISAQELSLYREVKRLFNEMRSGIGYVKLCRGLNKAGFTIGETRTKTIMHKLNLVCSQRHAYKCTTNSNHKNAISVNLLDQDFNPTEPNQKWITDITYLPIRQGWIYLAIVMDLYSRRIVGWVMSKRMSTQLITRALKHAHALRKPPLGLLHHSDTWCAIYKSCLS